jgi:hypothetical protein
MRELEQERQKVFHLSSMRDALQAELDQTCAALVSQQQLAACNSELHRMVASAEAVSVDTSSVLETVQHQLRAALSDAECSAAAKSNADRTCEAALRQLEQSTSIQMKQKERILELTSSLNETKSELQSILHRNNHTSQEVLDLKRSLASSVLQIADLQEASDKLRSKLMSQDATIVASTQELSVKEEYIRALQKTLESLGKERRKLQLQVLLEKYMRFHFDLFSRCSYMCFTLHYRCSPFPKQTMDESITDRSFGSSTIAPSAHTNHPHQDDELVFTLDSTTSTSSSATLTPDRDAHLHQCVHPRSDSAPECFQTVVTYNASFSTTQERMEFALQVC